MANSITIMANLFIITIPFNQIEKIEKLKNETLN